MTRFLPKFCMELFEYHAKGVLQRFGLPFSPYYSVNKASDVEALVSTYAIGVATISLQQAGMRKTLYTAQNAGDVISCVKQFLGQTSSDEGVGRQAVITPQPHVVASFDLGIRIEDATVVVSCARDGREHVFHEEVTEGVQLFPFQVNRLISDLKISNSQADQFHKIITGSLRAFFHVDATRLDVSPLVLTEDASFEIISVSLDIDPYALFRQPEMAYLLRRTDLRYLPLSGTVGCLSNGFALGLATIDVLRGNAVEVAGLYDIGAELTEERLIEGLRFLQARSDVQQILISIFTGLKDCEAVARAIKGELATWNPHKPAVVCFQGTNAAGGVRVVSEDTFPLRGSQVLLEAVKLIRTR